MHPRTLTLSLSWCCLWCWASFLKPDPWCSLLELEAGPPPLEGPQGQRQPHVPLHTHQRNEFSSNVDSWKQNLKCRIGNKRWHWRNQLSTRKEFKESQNSVGWKGLLKIKSKPLPRAGTSHLFLTSYLSNLLQKGQLTTHHETSY